MPGFLIPLPVALASGLCNPSVAAGARFYLWRSTEHLHRTAANLATQPLLICWQRRSTNCQSFWRI